MPIDVTCPKCNLILPAPDEYAGKRIRCADCETIVEVPVPGATTVEREYTPTVAGRERSDGDRPVRRRRPVEPAPRRAGLFLTIGGVFLATILAGGIWYWTTREDERPQPAPIPEPINIPLPIPAPNPTPVPKPSPAEIPAPLPKPTPTPTPIKPAPPTPLSPANPTDFTGLRFHLTFDRKIGSATLDSVSAKFVGKLADSATLIDGKRGKAIQVTPPPRSGGTVPLAIDLTDQKDRFAFDANAALTICHWASIDGTAPIYGLYLGQERMIDRPRIYSMSSRSSGTVFFYPGSSDYFSIPISHTGTSTWHHYALRRTSDGAWSYFVDGTSREPLSKNSVTNTGKLTFDKVGFGGTSTLKGKDLRPTIGIDDLCIFNRALADSEIARLAGKP